MGSLEEAKPACKQKYATNQSTNYFIAPCNYKLHNIDKKHE